MFIKGVNLGNWLVLEKWMSPALFYGTDAEDEYDLPRALSKEVYEARIRVHRSEYISERDFVHIRSMGLNTVRIPVPFFIFGDVDPYIGCIEELDKAFSWAKRYGLKILIDLHTVPGGQNGFDNGGISGVCKWAQSQEKVEFTLHVLERLAEREMNALYLSIRNKLAQVEVTLNNMAWVVTDDMAEPGVFNGAQTSYRKLARCHSSDTCDARHDALCSHGHDQAGVFQCP